MIHDWLTGPALRGDDMDRHAGHHQKTNLDSSSVSERDPDEDRQHTGELVLVATGWLNWRLTAMN